MQGYRARAEHGTSGILDQDQLAGPRAFRWFGSGVGGLVASSSASKSAVTGEQQALPQSAKLLYVSVWGRRIHPP
jgi:hypothetical protein